MTTDRTLHPDLSVQHRPGGGDRHQAGVGGTRRRWRMVALFVVVVTAVGVFSWFTRSADTTAVTVEDAVTVVEVNVAAGDVEIIRGDDSHVWFESRTEDGWIRAARIEHAVSGETLRIEGDCRGNSFVPAFGCRTNMTVRVPDGVAVRVQSDAGSIDAANLTGDTNLEVNAGEIDVIDQIGPLRAHTTAGNIRVTRLGAHDARVSSKAGAVDVHAITAPRSLDAESSAAQVTVTLPADQRYDVEASSRTGEVSVNADVSHTSIHKVRAFSNSGDVTVTTE
ncbi:DUF4097 family beta strand repeat-containing protein [Phytoactinopolyspora mesophila]|nr:DUF4097 family beta strand repeat-containing protein [Phytoactinopolyspora mesophila]